MPIIKAEKYVVLAAMVNLQSLEVIPGRRSNLWFFLFNVYIISNSDFVAFSNKD